MPRRTLIDFYADLSSTAGEFVVYDDGYRSWSYHCRDHEPRQGIRRAASQEGIGKEQAVTIWNGESRRVAHRDVGMLARGRRAGSD